MISLDFTNLNKIQPLHGLSQEKFLNTSSLVGPYLEKIHARNQGFYRTIDDVEMVRKVRGFSEKIAGRFCDVVVLGIGGSALGTFCLKQVFKNSFADQCPDAEHPRLHVLDNIDPSLIRDLDAILDYSKTLFLVVTKSGDTPETLAQYFYFLDKAKAQGLKTDEHFVFITDAEKGFLRRVAFDHPEITTFSVPSDVGGRFSVLSSVGLLPAALMGISIEDLLEGARAMRDRFLSTSFEENLPFQLAAAQHLLSQNGKGIHVLMPYSSKLIRFTDWWVQLTAESLGKIKVENGQKTHVGLTPLRAVGAMDQHAQSQLFHEGPNDKVILFIEVRSFENELAIPEAPLEDPAADYLKGVSFDRLLHSEKEATAASLTQYDRPNLTIRVEKLDEKSLGALFMLFEGATAFLGEFFEINAFDQPGVELAKKMTREMLKN